MTQLKTKGPYPADKFGWIGQERRINEDRDGQKHSRIENCFEMKNQRKNWATFSRISKASIFILIADRKNIFVYDLNKKLNFAKNKEFDLVLCLATLHNLNIKSAFSAIKEINRVGKKKYIMIDSYSNLTQLFNLQCWALTANIFFSDKDWEWFFKTTNYSGEYEFIHF